MHDPITAVHWNPRRPLVPGRFGRLVPLRKRVNNFGDLIGPLLVEKLRPATRAPRRHRLLTVGSVLHLARNGDTVWGTGRNGKIEHADHRFRTLDVRAVRGPKTRSFLESRGIYTPEIFGDPALLLPLIYPEYTDTAGRRRTTVVMNLNDAPELEALDANTLGRDVQFLSPHTSLEECLQTISRSEYVVGSSLHAIIVADAFGVPARLVRSTHEPLFKYEDYFNGTDRELEFSNSYQEAIAEGPHPSLNYDTTRLLDAFPHDLWEPHS